jgi:hypothetical protein
MLAARGSCPGRLCRDVDLDEPVAGHQLEARRTAEGEAFPRGRDRTVVGRRVQRVRRRIDRAGIYRLDLQALAVDAGDLEEAQVLGRDPAEEEDERLPEQVRAHADRGQAAEIGLDDEELRVVERDDQVAGLALPREGPQDEGLHLLPLSRPALARALANGLHADDVDGTRRDGRRNLVEHVPQGRGGQPLHRLSPGQLSAQGGRRGRRPPPKAP